MEMNSVVENVMILKFVTLLVGFYLKQAREIVRNVWIIQRKRIKV